MAEKGQTSSMTSVTEEEVSAGSESDTTESSYSNITSSLLSSTDTDDKLTPGLIKISISSTTNADGRTNKHKKQVGAEKAPTGKSNDSLLHKHSLLHTEAKDLYQDNTSEDGVSLTATNIPATVFVHPYGSNPLPLKHIRENKNQRWTDACLFPPFFDHCQIQPYVKQKLGRSCKENLGVDDTDNKLSTDFSDTSSIQIYGDRNNNNEFDVDSNEDEDTESIDSEKQKRPFLPDLSSDKWYQAQCFDRYWSHYGFVMEWYHLHVQALQMQAAGLWGYPQEMRYSHGPWQSNGEDFRRNQQSKKSSHRHRRKGRARRGNRRKSSSVSRSTADQDGTTHARTALKSPRHNEKLVDRDDDGEEMEMEITDEMLEFFTTSFKHKIERAKEGEEVPISTAPPERPGVRRTEEMKALYGAGAPMVQAMETAMQMSFDRFLDRFQPSPWPNMPLKISFTK